MIGTAGTRPHDGHRKVWELLPWYVNGTLSAPETAEVEKHLATCAACQQEVSRCRAMAAAVRAQPEDTWSPSPQHLAQVLTRIDTIEARPMRRWADRWGYHLKPLRWLEETPRPARWALALQGAFILVLGSALLWPTASLPPPMLYRTLSSEPKPVSADRVPLRLVFAEDITERELRALLLPLGATIVQGPSPIGVYTVEIPLAEATSERLPPMLKRLRAHPKVSLAEPVSSEQVP